MFTLSDFLNQEALNRFSFPEKIKLTKTIHDCLESDVEEKYYYNGKPLYEKFKKEITKKDTVYQWRRKYVRENKKWRMPDTDSEYGDGRTQCSASA